MPGSRPGELERNWARMSEVAARLQKRFDLEVVAMRAPALPEALFPGARERGIAVVTADLAFVASGTATLEAALCGAPMVVVYRVSAVSWAIVSALVHLRWASLVNIVAGEEIVPELIQDRFTVENLEREGAALLSSPARLAAMKAGLARVARLLGPPGASARAAEYVLSALAP